MMNWSDRDLDKEYEGTKDDMMALDENSNELEVFKAKSKLKKMTNLGDESENFVFICHKILKRFRMIMGEKS